MAKAHLSTPIGFAVALAALIGVAPVRAALPADMAAWVARHTDIAGARIAIVGPENVYGLEPLGPRTTTGEVIALIRSEPIAEETIAARGFASWEAHILFDCGEGRLKQIRSATWTERNRQGRARSQAPREGWVTPKEGEPALQLLAAACDPTFGWPLRGKTVAAGPEPRPAVIVAGPGPQPEYLPDIRPARASIAAVTAVPPAPIAPPAPKPAETVSAPAAPPPPSVAPRTGYALQLARGPREDGARDALRKAVRTLGASAEGLTPATELSHVGNAPRYTATLAGFASEDAAKTACGKLRAANQSCFTVAPTP